MGKEKQPETLEAALEVIAGQEKTIAQQAADLKEKDQVIADMRTSSKGKGEVPSFVHTDKKRYGVYVKSTSWKHKLISAEDICKDKDLQKALIAARVGFIKPM